MKELQSQTQPEIDVVNDNTEKINLERLKQRNDFRLDFLSLILAFILIILFVLSGVYLTATNHDTVGGIIFSTTIIGVAGLFITGAYNKTQK